MAQDLEDIATRADIVCLVDTFYESVRSDAVLGPIFDDIAHTDWDAHLPKMYDFWAAVLFGEPGFRGDPLVVHAALGARVALGAREFARWLDLFDAAVDERFCGPMAEYAKLRAARIAAVMLRHIGAVTEASRL